MGMEEADYDSFTVFCEGLPLLLNAQDCAALDRTPSALADFDVWRSAFASGPEGTLYFDANSIGPMPVDAPARMQQVLDAGWRQARRRGWSELDWLQQPASLGAAIAPMLGADASEVRVCDTTSINQYKLLCFALSRAAPRRVIVLEQDVFPSNRYVAEGIARSGLAELRFIRHADELPAALAAHDVAVVALSHVDYRTSARLDMAAFTRLAHDHGALALWDLSHSAGAVAIELKAAQADLAVGCGYKYLCGGPGAPAYLYVNAQLQGAHWPALAGWMGHADTFSFEPGYRPAPGTDRFLVGTPAVLANVAFSAAADIWRRVSPVALNDRHRSLTDTLIQLLDEQCGPLGLTVASPRSHAQRGGHVALQFDGAAPLSQAMVARGVVVSSRKPDALRFGVHPLTTTHADLWRAVQILRDLLATGDWRDPRYNGPVI